VVVRCRLSFVVVVVVVVVAKVIKAMHRCRRCRCLFVGRWFVGSFVRWFVGSLVKVIKATSLSSLSLFVRCRRLFVVVVCSLVRLFVGSFVLRFVR